MAMMMFAGMQDWSPNCRASCTDRDHEDEFSVNDKTFFADNAFLDTPDDMAVLLTDTTSFVRHLHDDPSMVDAFSWKPPGANRYVAGLDLDNMTIADACRPIVLDMSLPKDHTLGESIELQGPHGVFKMMPPDIAEAGDEMHYYLGPLPEFQIEVPPGFQPGSAIAIIRDDGSEVKVHIPENRRPGDTFSVEPPALMVLVPEGMKPGGVVRFRDGDSEQVDNVDWHWARIPVLLRPGGYFVARLPAPSPQHRRV